MDLKIKIPYEFAQQMEYNGDDVFLEFIMMTINLDYDKWVKLSLSQWIYLVDYLDEVFGNDSDIVTWLDSAISSKL